MRFTGFRAITHLPKKVKPMLLVAVRSSSSRMKVAFQQVLEETDWKRSHSGFTVIFRCERDLGLARYFRRSLRLRSLIPSSRKTRMPLCTLYQDRVYTI
jgi:hypothetical protein